VAEPPFLSITETLYQQFGAILSYLLSTITVGDLDVTFLDMCLVVTTKFQKISFIGYMHAEHENLFKPTHK
jgi:hypothetical protein